MCSLDTLAHRIECRRRLLEEARLKVADPSLTKAERQRSDKQCRNYGQQIRRLKKQLEAQQNAEVQHEVP